ncbi:MAG: carbohydrate binding domain-containing protein [Elusimicrobiota bacterium]
MGKEINRILQEFDLIDRCYIRGNGAEFTIENIDKKSGIGAGRVVYDFQKNESNDYRELVCSKEVDGKPRKVVVWIKGDGSNNTVAIRLRDRSGEMHQYKLCTLNFNGWKNIEVVLGKDALLGNTWLGDSNGELDVPVRVVSLVIMHPENAGLTGTVMFDGLALISEVSDTEVIKLGFVWEKQGVWVVDDKIGVCLRISNTDNNEHKAVLHLVVRSSYDKAVYSVEDEVVVPPNASIEKEAGVIISTSGYYIVDAWLAFGSTSTTVISTVVLKSDVSDNQNTKSKYFAVNTELATQRDTVREKVVKLVSSAGIGYAVEPLIWQVVETEELKYSFGNYKEYIDICQSNGIEPVISVDCSVIPYYGKEFTVQQRRDAFFKMVEMAVQKLSPGLWGVEFKNIESLVIRSAQDKSVDRFTAKEYAAVVKMLSDTAKRGNPKLKLLLNISSVKDLKLVEGIGSQLAGRFFDILTVSCEGNDLLQFTESSVYKNITGFTKNFKLKNVWLTDVGAGFTGREDRFYAGLITRAAVMFKNTEGITNVVWVAAQNKNVGSTDQYPGGIVGSHGLPSLQYLAIKVTIEMLQGCVKDPAFEDKINYNPGVLSYVFVSSKDNSRILALLPYKNIGNTGLSVSNDGAVITDNVGYTERVRPSLSKVSIPLCINEGVFVKLREITNMYLTPAHCVFEPDSAVIKPGEAEAVVRIKAEINTKILWEPNDYVHVSSTTTDVLSNTGAEVRVGLKKKEKLKKVIWLIGRLLSPYGFNIGTVKLQVVSP